MPVTVPAALVRELLAGRLDAGNRISAFIYAAASLRQGLPVTAAGLQTAWGLGRNAGYEILALARAAGADREPTGSADDRRTPTDVQAPGADREPTGSPPAAATVRPDPVAAPAPAPGADREPTGNLDRRQTPVMVAQPGADREPTGNPGAPAGDPPPYSLEISTQGIPQKKEDPAPPQEPAPVFPTAPDGASAAFLQQLRRWSSEPDVGDRWRVEPAADLAWFLTEIVPRAAEHGLLDLAETLRKWGVWLEKEHREKKARRKSKFPSAWKNALHTWIRNEARWAAQRAPSHPGGPNGRLSQPGRRGAFGTSSTRITVADRTGHGDVDDFDAPPPPEHR